MRMDELRFGKLVVGGNSYEFDLMICGGNHRSGGTV